MAKWGSTCNHNYLYRWLPCQYFILLMMGAWRPKHVEKVYSNKICILLHHVGVYLIFHAAVDTAPISWQPAALTFEIWIVLHAKFFVVVNSVYKRNHETWTLVFISKRFPCNTRIHFSHIHLCIYDNNVESDLHLFTDTVMLLITSKWHCVPSPYFHTSFLHFFHLHFFLPLFRFYSVLCSITLSLIFCSSPAKTLHVFLEVCNNNAIFFVLDFVHWLIFCESRSFGSRLCFRLQTMEALLSGPTRVGAFLAWRGKQSRLPKGRFLKKLDERQSKKEGRLRQWDIHNFQSPTELNAQTNFTKKIS